MSKILGIDTSNYTTSCALFDTDTFNIIQAKKLLPVKSNELGLRQSDAVFHHIKQFPDLISSLNGIDKDLIAVGVSTKPRWVEKSYMPCFLVGETIAQSIAVSSGIDVFRTSHQVGHILAALYSANKLSFLHGDKFLAFHVSGGTTDCLLCTPDEKEVLKVKEVGTSLDLKAGQAIDRVGVMLGLQFPCGKELEILAEGSKKEFIVKPTLKGNDCCISGLENKCKKMLIDKEDYADIAKYCLTYIAQTVDGMAREAVENYGDIPIIFAGGVMSNKYIKSRLENNFKSFFAKPEFSCDNACGTAIFAAIRKGIL
ncbi:MAG: peptidase M22 [Clostridiales bacterium]|nr:peptidase M22 [Clostridiales bacterium]